MGGLSSIGPSVNDHRSEEAVIRRRFFSVIKRIGLCLVLIYIGVVVLMISREGHYLYYPKVYPKEYFTPDRFGLEYQAVDLILSGGERVHGWWLPGNGDEESPVVLFFHGNAGHIADRMDLLRLLLTKPQIPLGGVLIPDYPGFGKSTGHASEKGCFETAEKFYEYLRQTAGVTEDRIVVFGRSLGAAVALHTAIYGKCAGLVLEVPFLSIPRMAEDYYPYIPGLKFFVRQRFDNEKAIKSLTVPLMIVAALKDKIISPEHSRRLYRLAPEPKRMVIIEGAGHSNTYTREPDKYWTAWSEYLVNLGFSADRSRENNSRAMQVE